MWAEASYDAQFDVVVRVEAATMRERLRSVLLSEKSPIRSIISETLEEAEKANWWDTARISEVIKKEVQGRIHLPPHPPVEHIPAVLHDIDPPQLHAGFKLREAKVRHADVARLALPDDVVERAHGFLERRVQIGPVHQVNIDMIGVEIAQTLLDRGHDARAAAVAAIGRLGITDADLGDDADIAPARTESATQRLLGNAHAVGFSGIETVNARRRARGARPVRTAQRRSDRKCR